MAGRTKSRRCIAHAVLSHRQRASSKVGPNGRQESANGTAMSFRSSFLLGVKVRSIARQWREDLRSYPQRVPVTTFVRCPVHMRPAAGRITDFLGIGLLHRDGTLKRRVKGGHGIDVAGGSLVPQFLSRANCGRERVQQDTCTDGGGTQMFGSLPRSSQRWGNA